MKVKLLYAFVLMLLLSSLSFAQDESIEIDTSVVVEELVLPAPPGNLSGVDKPNDHGHAINLSWELSPDDGGGLKSVMQYDVYHWVPNLMLELNLVRDSISVIQKIIRNIFDGQKFKAEHGTMYNNYLKESNSTTLKVIKK